MVPLEKRERGRGGGFLDGTGVRICSEVDGGYLSVKGEHDVPRIYKVRIENAR